MPVGLAQARTAVVQGASFSVDNAVLYLSNYSIEILVAVDKVSRTELRRRGAQKSTEFNISGRIS
jgi:hypothetical protein